ncbi:L-ribulokinase [Parabacteroides sp. PF5-5]|uniref:ribulokinase n=1 Tax=unclassified Parabacteroides TaxID=2649774 RepID=UPI002473DC37|nr:MULTISPECIES: ribulokinase [unclassified Parabacteroides]MDH6306132.1 L-ribulokinase [Parabacteroides sp. PH5-39]MDH6317091.1 L-ribulokinase [Parabacteroides sp. PF5-13]MDH6320844.1 L-ribulokinase [Parabacteroides sp. PH5-13]MDH6324575.1 L-ribulokinase [Parabacteroides sp. PH5-8]MDH6328374.1 L-ribulokinase [Parabacteroides sp. PH5-41]
MSKNNYVIGLDYGSDSCRAVVVDASTGKEMASAVKYYPRWMEGKYCDEKKNRYRQHPLDYIETLEYTVKEALAKCPAGTAEQVVGVAFDTTGSTPVLIDKEGTPLALLAEYAENPNAMFVLWKDHTAIKEAAEINELARRWGIDYTAYEGGIYSSEWVWAKMTHVLREDESIRKAAYSWIEHCDWLPALITGKTKPEEVYRSRCAAGHKAMWLEEWGGLPPEDFFTTLEPLLAGFRSHLFEKTYTSDTKVGNLTEEWAGRLGLTTNVAVAVGAFDCHMGAVGAEITPRTFVRVIGTSTCDIMVASHEEMKDKLIPGICGQVDGSVIPGMIGLEAGQSGFGDIYAWFKRVLSWPLENILSKSSLIDEETKQKLIEETADKIIPLLSEEAAKVPVAESSILAVDWMNGRRTPDASQLVKGTITGLNLGSSAPLIFRALVEATAFGSKAIVDRFLSNNIKIESVIGIGGISLKSPFVMQTMADVLGMPIKVAKAEQACAFGASMFAAVAAGVYGKVEDAQKAMGLGFAKEYHPNHDNHQAYLALYEKYSKLGKFTENELSLTINH